MYLKSGFYPTVRSFSTEKSSAPQLDNTWLLISLLHEKFGLGVVLELWRIAERDSGEVSGRAMRARSVGMYVRDAAPDSPGEERLAPG